MAYGNTLSTHITSFIGPPDINGVPIQWGTGTKLAIGWFGTTSSGTITVVGDIQKKGGSPPTGSQYGTALPNTDVIKSAFLVSKNGAAPTDVTRKCTIAGDNSVTMAAGTSGSNCYLFILYDAQDKMGAKN